VVTARAACSLITAFRSLVNSPLSSTGCVRNNESDP
jgi:hypothetical protein